MSQSRTRGLPRYQGSGLLRGLLIPLTIIEVAATIAQAFFLARAVASLFEGTLLTDVLSDAGFFFLAFMMRYLISHVQAYLAERYAMQTARTLRQKLLHAYFGNDLFFFQQKGVGHLVTLTLDGVDQVKAYLEIISIRMIKTVIIPAVIGLYILTLDLTSAVILVVAVPVIIMFMILLGKAAQAMADKQYDTYKRLSNHFIDSLKGLETLVFLGKSKHHAKKIDRVSNDYRRATMKTLRMAFLSSFALDFFTSLSIAFVAVGLGLRLIDGQIDLLPALTILILAPEYFSPIKQVGKDYHATLDGQVAIAEINTVLNESEKNVGLENVLSYKPVSDSISTPVNLSMNDVTVNLDGNQVLALSMDLPKGWIGIVGSSGSGKSTLISVLAGRLKLTSGTINLNGQTLQGLDQPSWFDRIAYIPQDPYIFPVSLADNIRFYAPDAKDQAIEALVDEIGMGDFVRTLPSGIHEAIGEGGRTLSGGQEQRVAIARALLSDKPIILLDEPTAHLDIETEFDIKQLMQAVFKDKQVILATHRLHWMNDVNSIYMLVNGQIEDHGSHEELIAKQGAYYQFVHWREGRIL